MRHSISMPVLAILLLTSACGSSKEDNQVTETRMDDLDGLEGTISDDMINTDQSTDEPPLEGAPAGADTANSATTDSDTAEQEPSAKAPAVPSKTDTPSETE